MRFLKRIMNLIEKINKSMIYPIGVIIAFLGFFICYEVIMRYLFNSPSNFGLDLMSWLTAIAAFLAGGYALANKEHIKVDVLYEKYSFRTRSIINVLADLCALIIAIVLIWIGGEYVLQMYDRGTIPLTGLRILEWIKWGIVPVGGILIALQSIVELIKNSYSAITNKQWEG